MKNRPIVKKLRLLISTLTKVQLQTLLARMKAKDYTQIQAWFTARGETLSAVHLAHLDRWGVKAVNHLYGEWKRGKALAFTAGKLKDLLADARLDAIEYMKLHEMTEDEAKDIFKAAFNSIGEVLNG